MSYENPMIRPTITGSSIPSVRVRLAETSRRDQPALREPRKRRSWRRAKRTR